MPLDRREFIAPQPFPTVAELAAQVPDQPVRRGTGGLFFSASRGSKLTVLPRMPAPNM